MVGSLVLQYCLKSPDIEKITSIVRRSSGIKDKKLIEVIHNDFLDFSKIRKHFKNIDIAYYCLGVYTGSVPKDEFKTITYDYTKALAKNLKEESPFAVFCLLSGSGADLTEKSKLAFAKYKGMAENFLFNNFKEAYTFRPGYIYPVTSRVEPNFTYRLSRKLYPILKILFPNGVITSEELAQVIFAVGLRGYQNNILENADMKKYFKGCIQWNKMVF